MYTLLGKACVRGLTFGEVMTEELKASITKVIAI
jgi:hypothetical protein